MLKKTILVAIVLIGAPTVAALAAATVLEMQIDRDKKKFDTTSK